MTDPIWTRDEPQSPCIRVCVIDEATGLCVGCYRTLQEIGDWATMPPAQRAEIMAALPGRAPQLRQRRGGRKAARARAGDPD